MSRTTRESSRQTSLRSCPGFDGAIGQRKRAGAVLGDDGVDQLEQQVAADEAEHGRHFVHRDRLARERHHLVERALRVAHAALRRRAR